MAGDRTILDAGPCLTFCAAHAERILFDVLSPIGPLQVPEAVDEEVWRKSTQNSKFRPVRSTWLKLKYSNRISVLSDSIDQPGLLEAAKALSLELETVRTRSKDRGERMVIIHALAMVERGLAPVVLVDDWYGQQLATLAGLQVLTTEMILVQAIRSEMIPDRGEMRRLYTRMRLLDDGLVDITQTRLLDAQTWNLHRP